jgi:hypothetical protein
MRKGDRPVAVDSQVHEVSKREANRRVTKNSHATLVGNENLVAGRSD